MDIFSDMIGEFFTQIAAFVLDWVCGDREVPKFAKILILLLIIALSAGIFLICWKMSE